MITVLVSYTHIYNSWYQTYNLCMLKWNHATVVQIIVLIATLLTKIIIFYYFSVDKLYSFPVVSSSLHA